MSQVIFDEQLLRLKRHYHNCLNGYDVISLRDLAGILRIFTELSGWIDSHRRPKLVIAGFDAGIKKVLRGAEFVYCYLPPDGVTVRAVSGLNELMKATGPLLAPSSGGVSAMMDGNQNLSIREFFLIYKALPGTDVKLLNDYSCKASQTRVDMNSYMHAEAIRFQFSGEEPKYISRSELIKRVANEYDGSHSSFADKSDAANNVYSTSVERLMQYSCAGVPLPFFVLMHIAKNILLSLEG